MQSSVLAGRAFFHINAVLLQHTNFDGMFWIFWFFTAGIHSYPWPIWPMMGWGIGVIFNYMAGYRFKNTAEKEYDKLKKAE